jgi:hypothetical protein
LSTWYYWYNVCFLYSGRQDLAGHRVHLWSLALGANKDDHELFFSGTRKTLTSATLSLLLRDQGPSFPRRVYSTWHLGLCSHQPYSTGRRPPCVSARCTNSLGEGETQCMCLTHYSPSNPMRLSLMLFFPFQCDLECPSTSQEVPLLLQFASQPQQNQNYHQAEPMPLSTG